MDTEGGAFEKDQDFINSIHYNEKLRNKILYLCWGEKYSVMLKKKYKNIDFITTGQPRFDVYHPKFLRLLRNSEKKKYFILFKAKCGKS